MSRKREYSKRVLIGLHTWIADSLDVCIASRDNGFRSYSEVIDVALTNFLRPTHYWTVNPDIDYKY